MTTPKLPTVEQIAEVCHELNRAYCRVVGDPEQPAWPLAPEWQRESAVNGVQDIVDERIRSPEAAHEQWMAEKLGAGWTLGPTKDPVAKTHPNLVPYYQLPFEQRQKDLLFFQTVQALACL